MFLHTDRMTLRRLSVDDFDVVAKIMRAQPVREIWEYYFSDEDVKKFIQKNLDYYERYNLGYFLAIESDTGNIVGMMALMPDEIEGKTYYEIGYILKEDKQGKGFAFEGAAFLMDYAFSQLNISEIIFEIRPKNERSLHVAAKLGAKQIGTFVKKVKGKQMEHLILSVKRS